jgi:hypothetical protein
MKLTASAALRTAILCGAAIAVSACVYDDPYHRGYYSGSYYGGGYGYNSGYYADPCEQDRAYCGYPMYEGGIYIDGNWYEGRHRYRDQDGRREYYLHGNWYAAERTRDRDDRGGRMNGGDRGMYDRDRGEHMNGDRGERMNDRDRDERMNDRDRHEDRDHDQDRDRHHMHDNDHDND